MLLKSLLTSAELLHSLDSTGGYCEDQLLILIHAGVSLAGHQVLLHPSHPLGQPIWVIQEQDPLNTGKEISADADHEAGF